MQQKFLNWPILGLPFSAFAIVHGKESLYLGLCCYFSLTIIDGTLLAIVKRVNRVYFEAKSFFLIP